MSHPACIKAAGISSLQQLAHLEQAIVKASVECPLIVRGACPIHISTFIEIATQIS